MRDRNPRRGFVSRPSDPDNWVRAPDPTATQNGAKADLFTARLTIDVTPELRGRIKVAAFRRGITVAEMVHNLLAHEFPNNPGGTA